MVVFGITGGSGSGKTSVSKMLEKLGVHIIDTDVIAHEIVEPNSECLNELVDYFGDSIRIKLPRKNGRHSLCRNRQTRS